MGILGARNAGIEVPNEAIDKALNFFQTCTMRGGGVSYMPSSSHGDGITRSAIATLVYAIGKRKDTPEYKSTVEFIKRRADYNVGSHYMFYTLYYMAQALFQSDFEAWQSWNQRTIERLQRMQQQDGSFNSSHGKAYGTGMAVLTLALNYRLLPIYER
jgi:prenyltransferase beta subunit